MTRAEIEAAARKAGWKAIYQNDPPEDAIERYRFFAATDAAVSHALDLAREALPEVPQWWRGETAQGGEYYRRLVVDLLTPAKEAK